MLVSKMGQDVVDNLFMSEIHKLPTKNVPFSSPLPLSIPSHLGIPFQINLLGPFCANLCI